MSFRDDMAEEFEAATTGEFSVVAVFSFQGGDHSLSGILDDTEETIDHEEGSTLVRYIRFSCHKRSLGGRVIKKDIQVTIEGVRYKVKRDPLPESEGNILVELYNV